ncbi:YeeE/YedE family protein [Limosilactobacillus antri]|uniref:YeeE/YedE family protein n=1 Tax=Limosilactobacillus antri TaxID=227943 RepID=UPI001F5A1085|nr:YeeE/YedE family protein [Limosilactobacillus antri]
MVFSGLIFGFLFGFLLKRSHYCIAGSLRDVYLQRDISGLLAVFMIIFPQSLILFTLIQTGTIARPEYPDYSLFAMIIGSLLFGAGTVFASGCMSGTLVKVGDGRFTGLVSLLSFALFVVSSNNGLIANWTSPLQNISIKSDSFIDHLSFSPLNIIIPLLLIVLVWGGYYLRKKELRIPLPTQFTGFRYWLFEKQMSKLVAALLIGIVAGFAFLFNYWSHSFGGFAITGPVTSWLSLIIGGGVQLNWGMYFIVGIILGSLICAIGKGEFKLQGSDGKSLLKAFIGGALMGLGASLAKGCLVSNGLVYTAMLSVQGWIGLIFIIIGNWVTAFLMFKLPLLKPMH